MNFSSRRAGWWLAICLFAVAWFGCLDYRRLIDPDEGRYAEIAREMVVSGDWLTPRLNGFRYFEKPPLQYWATATAFSLFGEHHWSARLWAALTGFLGVLFTAFAAGRLFDRQTGWMAGVVLAGSLLWGLVGHVNTLDMGVSAFLAAAIFALCLAQRDGATPVESRRWQDGAWVLLALATLSKGLIGIVLPAAAVTIYALWQRDLDLFRRIRLWRGLGIFLLLAAPWFIAVSLVNPGFAEFFFVHEHFQRFLTTVHHRYAPVWYFVPILLAGILPWLGSLWPGIKDGWRADEGKHFQPQRLLLVWAGLVFVFFSLSDSKLTSYILPMFPALAVLIARHLTVPGRGHANAWLTLGAGLLGWYIVPFAIYRADTPVMEEIYRHYQQWLYAAVILFAAGGGARIVGAVTYSDYPKQAQSIPRVGDNKALDLERIVALKPDLIVVWRHGNAQRQLERLRELHIPLFFSEPHRLDDIAVSLTKLGQLLGTSSTADPAAAAYRRDIANLQAQYAKRPAVTVFYQVWDQPLMTLNCEHMVSDVI
jgi:4-amino-4-deoxy-L-arabinose transferase-like glycosyltransferase